MQLPKVRCFEFVAQSIRTYVGSAEKKIGIHVTLLLFQATRAAPSLQATVAATVAAPSLQAQVQATVPAPSVQQVQALA